VNYPGAIVYRKGDSEAPLPAVFAFNGQSYGLPTAAPPLFRPVPPVLPKQKPSETGTRDGRGKLQMPAVELPIQLPPVQASRPASAAQTEDTAPPDPALQIRALADQGRLTEAVDLCANALAADKLNPGLYCLHAVILQELNRPDEAAAALQRALYLDQDHLLAHFALANLALRQDRPAAARKSFRNALSLLEKCQQEDILPGSDGMTAGRFREIINATMETGALA
jgi:chemotaxis protein methyltransferase CheR